MEAIAGLIGFLTGHAFDLVFERVYSGTPLDEPLQRCSACRSGIRRQFLLPLLGTLWSRGRCPDCGAWLPWRAYVLPAGGATLFASASLTYDEFGAALLAGFFATVFLVLTLTDLEQRLIPNRVVYPSLLLAAALSWGWPDTSVVEVFAGGLVAVAMAAALLAFSLPFGASAFGLGDVKMIVLMGLVLGLPSVVIAVFVGTLAAGGIAALLLLLRLRSRRDTIPHGPFLALGGMVGLFWGQDIWDWYSNR